MCARSAALIGRISSGTFASRARAELSIPLCFIVLALLFSAARRKIAVWEKSGSDASSAILVFERPYAAALATTLVLVTAPLFFQLPTVVRQLLTIVSLVPMLRLARPMISASVAFVLYTCCFLFAVDTLRQAFGGHTSDRSNDPCRRNPRRDHRAVLDAPPLSANHCRESGVFRSDRPEVQEDFCLLSFSLSRYWRRLAGYTRLARLLTPGILVGGILALLTFASLRVGGGIVALALRVWPLSSLQMVAHHRELLEKRSLPAADLASGHGLVDPLPELSRSFGSRVVLRTSTARSQAGARLHLHLARQCPGIFSDRLVGLLAVTLSSLRFARGCLPENRSRPGSVVRRLQFAQLRYSRPRIRRRTGSAWGGFLQGRVSSPARSASASALGCRVSSIILSPVLSCCSSGRYTSAIRSRSAIFRAWCAASAYARASYTRDRAPISSCPIRSL